MPTTTRAVFRQKVSENMGDRITATTTSAGNAGGTTLISTALPDEDFGGDNEAFNSFWVLITSGTNSGEIRRVARTSGYVASSGTLTVTRAFTAQVASSVTFELHRYDPRLKHAAISRALNHAYPHVFREIVDETLVVDNRLLNADFEDTAGAGTFDDWTEVNSPTVTIETTRVRHGTNAAKVVAGGSAGQLTQTLTLNVHELIGKSITLSYPVYATAASVARVRLDFDGSDIQSTAYHSGADQWEVLTLTTTVPTAATQVKVILETAASGTAYFDAGWCAIGPLTEYTIPATILKGPHHVLQQAYADFVEGPYWQPRYLMQGRRLRLIGMGVLSVLSADTDTAECAGLQADCIAYIATAFTFEMLAAHAAAD